MYACIVYKNICVKRLPLFIWRHYKIKNDKHKKQGEKCCKYL